MLRKLGEPLGSGRSGPVGPAQAMLRVAKPDARYQDAESEDLSEQRDAPVAPAQRDEIDELFTGGS